MEVTFEIKLPRKTIQHIFRDDKYVGMYINGKLTDCGAMELGQMLDEALENRLLNARFKKLFTP